MVSERLHRLAGGEFDYEDLGELDLKGIAVPTRAYGVLGVGTATSRFDATVREKVSLLVGRAEEMKTLLDRWQSVGDSGTGEAVLLSGEPGMGKSRIASALLDAWGLRACSRCGFSAHRSTSTARFIRSLPISKGFSTLAATRRRAPGQAGSAHRRALQNACGRREIASRHALPAARGALRPAHHGTAPCQGRDDPRSGGYREGGSAGGALSVAL